MNDPHREALKTAGYALARTRGGHEVWTKPGTRPVTLVHHGTRDKRNHVNRQAVRRALRRGN